MTMEQNKFHSTDNQPEKKGGDGTPFVSGKASKKKTTWKERQEESLGEKNLGEGKEEKSGHNTKMGKTAGKKNQINKSFF